MKLLFIAPFPIDPPSAGNRTRVANFIAALTAAGHEVHFAHIHTGDFDGEAMARRLGPDRLHLLPFSHQPPIESRAARIVRSLAQRLGWERAFMWPVDSWYSNSYTPLLTSLQQREVFDVVVVAYVFMTRAFEAFPAPCLRVLDTHDIFGLRHRRYLEIGLRPQWFSTTFDDEETALHRADLVVAIQEEEARILHRRLDNDTKTRVLTVGHLVDLPELLPLSEQKVAVFLGSHNHINVHALTYFLEQVHPLIRAEIPDFELLVGGDAGGLVSNHPGLVKCGFVANLSDLFSRGMIFVNPVLMGTGMTIKLLDAMAHGMPCVSTQTGARGLQQETGGVDVVSDNDPRAFADCILALLRSRILREERRRASRISAELWNRSQLESLSKLLRAVKDNAAAR